MLVAQGITSLFTLNGVFMASIFNTKYKGSSGLLDQATMSGLFSGLGATYTPNKTASTSSKSTAAAPAATRMNIKNPYFQYGATAPTQAAASTESADGSWDFSNVGKPVTMAGANAEYDYSPVDQAISSYGKGSGYNPYQFNFANQDLINQAAQNQYALGATSVNRQGASDLARLRETVGPRNAGLLAKLGEKNQRSVAENLAQMQTGLNTSALQQGLQLGAEQQKAQAGENQYAASLAKDYLDALYNAGQGKISTQAGIKNQEAALQEQKLQDLYNQFQYRTSLKAQEDANKKKLMGGLLGGIGSLGSAGISKI